MINAYFKMQAPERAEILDECRFLRRCYVTLWNYTDYRNHVARLRRGVVRYYLFRKRWPMLSAFVAVTALAKLQSLHSR